MVQLAQCLKIAENLEFPKMAQLERSATARFERVLAQGERAAAVRALDSAGAKVASWASRSGRTYALLRLRSDARLEPIGSVPNARIDEPPLLILDVTPRDPERIPALLHAFEGPGRPAGVVEARAGGDSLTVELDESITPLRLVVDLIDAELEPSPGRRIVPLFGLGDASLTAFAAAILHAPEIDVSRLIETYSEPLLQGER